MYGLSGFVKNLNSTNTLNEQNRVNSTENCVHQMYKLSRYAEKLNIQTLHQFNDKFGTLDVQIVWNCRKFKYP